ncbi:MAG: diguanylate cyclase, partial [Motiliproteus sp.]|nr:diguanylate cyclase [Motiliproteus sp.]
VMIPQPIAELEEHASQIQIAAIILGVMAAIVTALISWWMAGFIAAPVIRACDAARQISKGKFDQRVDVRTVLVPAEMKDLAMAFNRMSDEVHHSQQILEQRVEERTEELREEIKTRKAAEEKVRFLAMHDAVTGLPNRVALHDRIDECLQQKRVVGDMLAVLFIDLDGFKPINDRYGHAMGDLVLSEIGDRLGESLRNDDIVARYGGDEFVVLLTNQHSACKAADVAEKLRMEIAGPIQINGQELQVAASIGVVTTDAKGADINKMLREADQAMYRAKSQGKNTI